jgi:peroxiredoxin
MRSSLSVAAVLLLCALSLQGAGDLSNRRAPGFSLPDVNLRQHDLADYRGKVVLIEIMQTNCPHCQVFGKILEEAKAKYGDKVAILSVVNPPDNQASVTRYVRDTKSTIPILFDCGQMAASYLKVTPANPAINVPHLFIIDGNGMIRNDFGYNAANKGIFEGRALFAEVDRVLAAKTEPGKE